MRALSILNQFNVDEIVEIQDKLERGIVELARGGDGVSYPKLSKATGIDLLVVTSFVEKNPALYDLMQLAKVAKVSEIEDRLAQLAMGGLGSMVPSGQFSEKWFPGMDAVELNAAKLLLEAHDPRHSKRSVTLMIDNPNVPVGIEGNNRAVSAMDVLSKRLLQMGVGK